MTPLSESEVIQACQKLFGSEVIICSGFLLYLQPEGARSAYRKKAKETHPDFFASETANVQVRQTHLFREILQAYDVVTLFFKQREQGVCCITSQDTVTRQHHENDGEETRSDKDFAGNDTAETFQQRPLPIRPLEIGRYLFYRGYISYQTLIDALVWQRKQRPIIGDLAQRWGWLDAAEIGHICRAGGRRCRFGEKAMELGLLTSFQVKTLIFYQRSQQERLGKYFVQVRVLAPDDMERLAQELREHNAYVRYGMTRTGQGQNAYA